MFKWLRSLGPIGSFVADVLTIITASWIAVISGAIAMIAGVWKWSRDLLLTPEVYVTIGAFLAIFWTFIGIVILLDRKKPRLTRVEQDLRYGLTFEGLAPTYNPMTEDAALGFGLQFRNFSSGPIRYTIEHFDVRIGSRSLPKMKKGDLTCFLPRGAGRTSSNIPFKKADITEFIGERAEGTVDFEVVYGHPEKESVRRLKMSLGVIIILPSISDALPAALLPFIPVQFAASIQEESDEALPIQLQPPED